MRVQQVSMIQDFTSYGITSAGLTEARLNIMGDTYVACIKIAQIPGVGLAGKKEFLKTEANVPQIEQLLAGKDARYLLMEGSCVILWRT